MSEVTRYIKNYKCIRVNSNLIYSCLHVYSAQCFKTLMFAYYSREDLEVFRIVNYSDSCISVFSSYRNK